MSEVTVWIDSDEWYPVYHLRESEGFETRVPAEQVDAWRRATAAFLQAQDEMADYHEAERVAAAEAAQRARAERLAAEKEKERQVAAERKALAAERRKRQTKMQTQIEKSGGVLYDAAGNPVAAVIEGPTGIRLEPRP